MVEFCLVERFSLPPAKKIKILEGFCLDYRSRIFKLGNPNFWGCLGNLNLAVSLCQLFCTDSAQFLVFFGFFSSAAPHPCPL